MTTPATCGKDGVETYTCSVCGDSYTEAITATGDHDYESTVTTLATCGKDGVRTYTCSACGDSYTEAIPATGDHTYDNACDADCNACGNSRTPADHVYTADCDTVCDVCGAPRSVTAAAEATISFASTDDRVSLSTNTQVWENGGLTVTNNKTSGSSNIADYSNPVRFYKSSQIIIAYPGMTSLTITAPAGTYGTPWGATLEAAGYDYTGSDGVYTVIFSQPVDSVTLTASAQIRASSITVTAEGVGAEHVYDNACDATCNNCGTERETDGHDYAATVTTSATCGKDGVRTYTCSACGDSYTEAITATGDHTYDNACDADCNGCGATRIPADHVYGHDFDTDCDVCGAPRQIDTCVYSDTVLTSYMEMAGGTGGLAFQFEANVSGAVRNNDQSADLTNATVTINGAAYKVVALGAVVTNEKAVGTDPALMVRESAEGTDRVADVNATYLFSAEDNACTFAVRVIDIPANHFDSPIYARPYCIIECDGEQIVLYEDIVSATCNG